MIKKSTRSVGLLFEKSRCFYYKALFMNDKREIRNDKTILWLLLSAVVYYLLTSAHP